MNKKLEFPTAEAFRLWLEGISHHRVPVGETWSVCGCPLATFLNEHFREQGLTFRVARGWARVVQTGIIFHLPAWAAQFIRWLDGNGPKRSVYAKECLEVLEDALSPTRLRNRSYA